MRAAPVAEQLADAIEVRFQPTSVGVEHEIHVRT